MYTAEKSTYLGNNAGDPGFLASIIFTDEAENPHVLMESGPQLFAEQTSFHHDNAPAYFWTALENIYTKIFHLDG